MSSTNATIYKLAFAFLIVIASEVCSCKCYQELDVNTRVTFLSRGSGGNGGWITYRDNLLLDKDTAENLSVSDYIGIAKKYIDTVKTTPPVSIVDFFGITSCTTPIDSYNPQNKYLVISISFNNSFRKNWNKTPQVDGVSIWKQGHLWRMYLPPLIIEWNGSKERWTKTNADTVQIMFNSIQKSTTPIKNLITVSE